MLDGAALFWIKRCEIGGAHDSFAWRSADASPSVPVVPLRIIVCTVRSVNALCRIKSSDRAGLCSRRRGKCGGRCSQCRARGGAAPEPVSVFISRKTQKLYRLDEPTMSQRPGKMSGLYSVGPIYPFDSMRFF